MDFLKNCVKGFLAAILASGVLLFVFGYICYTREDPQSLINILGVFALYAGAFAGGFVSARSNKSMGLLSGLATGGIIMLSVLIVSLILRDGQESIDLVTCIMFVLIALVAAVGGFLGIPSAKKRKKHSRKRKKAM